MFKDERGWLWEDNYFSIVKDSRRESWGLTDGALASDVAHSLLACAILYNIGQIVNSIKSVWWTRQQASSQRRTNDKISKAREGATTSHVPFPLFQESAVSLGGCQSPHWLPKPMRRPFVFTQMELLSALYPLPPLSNIGTTRSRRLSTWLPWRR